MRDAIGTQLAPSAVSRLERFTASDFRNLGHLTIDVPPGGLVVVGDNGQGKTNFLEGIGYLHAWRSVRGARDTDLVRFGAAAFHLTAVCAGSVFHEVRAGFERSTKKKRVTMDGVTIARLSDALGAFPSVTVSPRDIEVINGPPSERRRLVDVLLALASPRYLGALQDYRAALVRRNATIRTASRAADAAARVAAWEGTLASAGAVLCTMRAAWVRDAKARYAELCELLGERETGALRYRASVEGSGQGDEAATRTLLHDALDRHRANDMRRGSTHVGPHRDDLELRLGGRLLRTFGSAGQHRSAALALRLMEGESLRARLHQEPLLLLDDPFAELDRERSRRVLDLLLAREGAQVILAVPKSTDIPDPFAHLAKLRMCGGILTPMTDVGDG